MWFDFVFPGPCRRPPERDGGYNQIRSRVSGNRKSHGSVTSRPKGLQAYCQALCLRCRKGCSGVKLLSISCVLFSACLVLSSLSISSVVPYYYLSYLHTQCLSASVTSSDDFGTTCTLAYSDIRAIPYLFTSFFVSSKATAGPDSCEALRSFFLVADHGGGLSGFNTILPRSPGRDHGVLS